MILQFHSFYSIVQSPFLFPCFNQILESQTVSLLKILPFLIRSQSKKFIQKWKQKNQKSKKFQINKFRTFQEQIYKLQTTPIKKQASMHELKLTLMKEKDVLMDKSKDTSIFRSCHNKSKSQSMWVFDDDSQQIPQVSSSQKFNDSTCFLESRLTQLLKKDKRISQTTFDMVVQEFQQIIGQGKNQVSYLLVIEDKLTDMIEEMSGDKKSIQLIILSEYFQEFVAMVERKIAQIRKREKKHDLLEFDKIVKKNFIKKDQLLQIPSSSNSNTFLGVSGAIKQRQKSASKSRQKQVKNNRNESRQKSTDKPLNKLLLKEKHIKMQKHEQYSQTANQTYTNQTQESMSYSAIMSASCAVRQRNRPRKNTKRKGELEVHQNNKDEQGQQDKEKAFVFYRPKKNK